MATLHGRWRAPCQVLFQVAGMTPFDVSAHVGMTALPRAEYGDDS
jgi:hypothetical protein